MLQCNFCEPGPCSLQEAPQALLQALGIPQTDEHRRIIAEFLSRVCQTTTEEKSIMKTINYLHSSLSAVAHVQFRGRWYMLAKQELVDDNIE